MRRDITEDSTSHLPTVIVTVEAFYVRTIFYAVILVVIQSAENLKRATHADASQNEITRPAQTEVEVSRFIQKNVRDICHRSVLENFSFVLLRGLTTLRFLDSCNTVDDSYASERDLTTSSSLPRSSMTFTAT